MLNLTSKKAHIIIVDKIRNPKRAICPLITQDFLDTHETHTDNNLTNKLSTEWCIKKYMHIRQ